MKRLTRASRIVPALGFALLLVLLHDAVARADSRTVVFDRRSGYIRVIYHGRVDTGMPSHVRDSSAIRPLPRRQDHPQRPGGPPSASPSTQAPGRSRTSTASTSQATTSELQAASSVGAVTETLATLPPSLPTTTLDTDLLVLDLPQGQELDPLAYKVDVQTLNLVPNDRITVSAESVVLRAGTSDTAELLITKTDAAGVPLTGDASVVWVGLVPVVNGGIALPGTPLAGTPPYGRLLLRPRAFANGVCRIVLQAAPTPGNDMIVITQPGLEPEFVQVFFE